MKAFSMMLLIVLLVVSPRLFAEEPETSADGTPALMPDAKAAAESGEGQADPKAGKDGDAKGDPAFDFNKAKVETEGSATTQICVTCSQKAAECVCVMDGEKRTSCIGEDPCIRPDSAGRRDNAAPNGTAK